MVHTHPIYSPGVSNIIRRDHLHYKFSEIGSTGLVNEESYCAGRSNNVPELLENL